SDVVLFRSVLFFIFFFICLVIYRLFYTFFSSYANIQLKKFFIFDNNPSFSLLLVTSSSTCCSFSGSLSSVFSIYSYIFVCSSLSSSSELVSKFFSFSNSIGAVNLVREFVLL